MFFSDDFTVIIQENDISTLFQQKEKMCNDYYTVLYATVQRVSPHSDVIDMLISAQSHSKYFREGCTVSWLDVIALIMRSLTSRVNYWT